MENRKNQDQIYKIMKKQIKLKKVIKISHTIYFPKKISGKRIKVEYIKFSYYDFLILPEKIF